MRDIAERMLAVGGVNVPIIANGVGRFTLSISGTRLEFDPKDAKSAFSFERLAKAVAGEIAFNRANQMIVAADQHGENAPLWLVSGSVVLDSWLTWARARDALRKVLLLTDEFGLQPVAGQLLRRARRDIGQPGCRIRIRGGQAVAHHLELSKNPRCSAIVSEQSLVRIVGAKLPEAIVSDLQAVSSSGDPLPLRHIIEHPAFSALELPIIDVREMRGDLFMEVKAQKVPLEPIPSAALSAVPPDADPVCPWRATAYEQTELNTLVAEAHSRMAVKRDRH